MFCREERAQDRHPVPTDSQQTLFHFFEREKQAMKRPLVAILLAVAPATQACNDSTNTPSGDSLEQAEVLGLAIGLATIGALPTTTGQGSTAVASCPEGGNVQFAGSIIPDSANDKILRMDVTMSPRSCGLSAGGTTFTINGSPGIRQRGTATFSDSLFGPTALSYEIDGGVDWSVASPARSGNCAIDMNLTGTVDLPTPQSSDTLPTLSGTVAGRFCGTSVTIPLDSIQG